MTALPRPLRFLALLLAALQLTSRPFATWEDARLAAAASRAAAEGSLVHGEDGRQQQCARVHHADCEFCRLIAASQEGAAPASLDLPVSSDETRPLPPALVRPASSAKSPETARSPPLV